jgi:Tol biopolymer transport system component
MALTTGTRLGPYEILSALGAGGMGEVYRARDTRLDRIVAIKILPEALAADPQFRERFEREARAISQLTHPHICTLHDIGRQDLTEFLVMEYLEGETLADRLTKGALALDQALTIAIQIASALDTAHRAVIVHRDFKPGNIMLTRSGGPSSAPTAKLLDFGLAKASAPAAGAGLSMLPTTPPGLTAQGTILGTFQYMAPEQLEGQEADARTDIFAFGAVLYEMLTGKKAFEGKSHASLIGAILKDEPPAISTVQPHSPPALDRVVRKCLAKDPEARWQSAYDLRDELQWIAEARAHAEGSTPVVVKRSGHGRLAWVASGVCLTALLAVVALARAGYFSQPPPDAGTYRSTYALPEGLRFPPPPLPSPYGRFALSPDGRRLAFVATDVNGRVQLWVRALDTLVAEPLAGTDGALYPFWSPDSRFIAFVAQNRLKKIGVSGGPPVTISEPAAGVRGAWNADDVILFNTSVRSLNRVSASAGASSPPTVLDVGQGERVHGLPFFLPDGRHFLYTAGNTTANPASVYVASLDPQETSRLLLPGAVGAMYAQGRVIFLRGTTLMAQSFDAGRRELMGDAAPIAEGIDVAGGLANAGAFSVSASGVLAYQTRVGDVRSQLRWVDRGGRQLAALGETAVQNSLELSPDGARAAVSLLDLARNTRDLWIYDVVRGLRTRFTFDPTDELHPVWSPDGSHLAYGSTRKGTLDVYQRASTGGAGQEQALLEGPGNQYLTSWSPDGRFLMYFNGTGGSPRTLQDLWVLPVVGAHKPTAFVQTEASEAEGRFSPDGRWVAYSSDESGRVEIYVAPFPGPGEKWQVSTSGGTQPRWRRDGKELFYLSLDNKVIAADVNGQAAAFTIGAVQTLFDARAITLPYGQYSPGYCYDVSPDGQRFLINTAEGQTGAIPITLVVNWTAGLKK